MNIFDRYYSWKAEKQKIKEKKRRISGYDYALGKMTRGEMTPCDIDALTYHAERSSFDDGMDDAIDYMLRFYLIEDDRI